MKGINFLKLLKSLRAAFSGLRSALSENTFRIFILCAVLIIILMTLIDLTFSDRIIIVLVITLILSLELINSQVERILDIIQPSYNLQVKTIKDISAGAVLIASLGALIIGLLIFFPYLIKFFTK
jgi:diacylglycerol kinase